MASEKPSANDEGFLAALGFVPDQGDPPRPQAESSPGTIYRSKSRDTTEAKQAENQAEEALAKVDPGTAFKAAVSGTPSELPHRQEMEQQFSTSFEDVQAHVGTPEAKVGLALLQAEAATVGRQVAFADTAPDKHLVAHEATHLVQAGPGASNAEPARVSSPGETAEREAAATATAVASGEQARVGAQADEGTVHRSLLGGIIGGVIGAVGGAVVGALLGGPVGAIIGGVVGAAGGAAIGAAVTGSTDPRLDHNVDPEMLDAHKNDPDISYQNFSETGTLFVNGISPEDVIQPRIEGVFALNDCYMLSVLGSLANDNPEFIRGMIRTDGAGKYSVRLYEKQDDDSFSEVWIAVSAELPASSNTPLYGRSEDRDGDGRIELWPSIIEKAYAKLKGNYPDIDWGNTIYAYEAIFGTRGGKSTTATTTADEQWKELKAALDGQEAVVCSTGRHVITVLSYSEEGGNRRVEVRDQGQAGGDEDGRETIDFDVFRTRYTYFRHTAARTPE